RGLTFKDLLLVIAVLAVVALLLFAFCSGDSGPLTAQGGRNAAGAIHGEVLRLIGDTTSPVAQIATPIRTRVFAQIEANRNREGLADFISGLCAELILLTTNRIQSAEGAEQRRLQEFLPLLRQLCEEAQQEVANPGG
ncbi:MAG TPA: hypothetical protein VLA09_11285, partial [Longimicrobiales bacterium]|nr:hypothetical protein [Longimicrobiales bacterium]